MVSSGIGASAIDIRHSLELFIDGAWTPCRGGRRLQLVNPATEETFAEVAEGGEEDIDAAVAAARKAFDHGPWPNMTPMQRGEALQRMVAYLNTRTEALAHAWVQQIGVPHGWATANTGPAVGFFSLYAGLAESFPWVEARTTYFPDCEALLAYEPVGVVAAIVPWNAPFFTAANKVAPALMAGCSVILKPSPETPLEAYIIAEAAEAAGLPPGVLNMVPADRAASEHLVRHADVDKVSFTGSSAVGKRIFSLCGERVARVTLELGGKSAAIILDDYDVQRAADELATSACTLSGQVCSNLTRYLVPEKKHDDFVDALSARMAGISVGDPYAQATQMGPLAMKRQLDRVLGYIEAGRQSGARLATGGGRPTGLNRGYYFEPTVFANVDNNSVIAREEIFGPVVCVIPYTSPDHAIALANDSPFGLNGAVFTDDNDRAYEVARAVRTGTMGQNGSRTDFSIAFGGFKQSGIGREGGVIGMMPYLEPKTIVLAAAPHDETGVAQPVH